LPNRLWLALLIATLTGPALHAQCALERAIQLYQAGDFPGAIREYQACIAVAPNRVEARPNLGAVKMP
jgi:Tetratricopeptide repeat